MSGNNKIKLQTRLSRDDVAGVLEALVEGLKEGLLRIQKSEACLDLHVPRYVDLEIEAEYDENKAGIEVELSWRTNKAENPNLVEDDEAVASSSIFFAENGEAEQIEEAAMAAKEKVKDAAAAVGSVAKAATKVASRKASEAFVKAVDNTKHAFEKAAEKTKKTVEDIVEKTGQHSASNAEAETKKNQPKERSSKKSAEGTKKTTPGAVKSKKAAASSKKTATTKKSSTVKVVNSSATPKNTTIAPNSAATPKK